MASAANCATHLYMSTESFRVLLDSGAVTKRDRGEYELEEVRREYILYMRSIAKGRGAGDGAIGLTEERAKLAQAQRIGVEMKNAETAKELVRIELVGRQVEECFSNVRGRLVTIPGKLAAALVGKDRAAIEDRLGQELNEILAELYDPDTIARRILSDDDGDGGAVERGMARRQPGEPAQEGGEGLQAAPEAQSR